MPYKRRNPVSEEEMEYVAEGMMVLNHPPQPYPVAESEMDRSRWEGHHSVCQTLRDIYHLTDNSEIKLKCRLAMAMTKAMHEKLKEYKNATTR